MKKVTLVVAVAVSAFLIGCQESSNVNPISNDFTKTSISKIQASSPDGIFELSGQLTLGENEGVDNTYDLSGQIQYTLVQRDEEAFTFSVATQANLTSLIEKGPSGSASGESIDDVVLSGKEPAVYEKVYEVSGFDKQVELHVQFQISANEIAIAQMWLSEHRGFDRAASAK